MKPYSVYQTTWLERLNSGALSDLLSHVSREEFQRPKEKSGKTSSTTGQSISVSVKACMIYVYGTKVVIGPCRSLESVIRDYLGIIRAGKICPKRMIIHWTQNVHHLYATAEL